MNMYNRSRIIFILLALFATSSAVAQTSVSDVTDVTRETEELKLAALQALMMAPSERALPIVKKVLQGNNSDELKESALFILSQIGLPEAQVILVDFARDGDGEMRLSAIRMIGIGGDVNALSELSGLYDSGDAEVRDAVLEAYLIADDSAAVYKLAATTDDKNAFEEAVHMLGMMGAHDELRKLRDRSGMSEALIHAYAMSGDAETLREIAIDGSNVERQTQAIESMGMVGGREVSDTLVEIYSNSDSDDVKEAALHGLLMSGYDEGVLQLYRESQDMGEKRELLEMLVMMGSDQIYDVIDQALSGNR
ncbi:MAG: HEAT repeat domain-containing protein [Proteobacteria bacterium]|nr:HEAT repeat domain-containing protein [Pseudomonadota bacterium]